MTTSDQHHQTPADSTQHSAGTSGESVKSLVVLIITLLVVILAIREYVAKPFIVYGPSMYPTFDSWNYLIVDEFTYRFIHEPERGDVVVFNYPARPSEQFIKRVIGLPGDKVELDRYRVIINDSLVLDEPYILESKQRASKRVITLADDEYFVMGDNRLESMDSRIFGPVKRKYFIGRPVARLYPFKQIGLFPGKAIYGNHDKQ